ncbi:hypothetical protein B6U67_03675 [Methanosarcinales archaeon ex4484_138]|nr:MAG: hypothetical protein B6U67_03675 [Methanosarcinales archaeon ex4484_138]
MESKSLPVILHDLSDSIIEEVKSGKERGKIEIFEERHVKHKISDFNYAKGITGFQTTHEYFTKEKCRWKDESEFEKKVEASKSFQATIEKIVQMYNIEETEAKSWVSKFVKEITDVCLDEINNDKIIELITLLISDLEENPILWQPVVWIDGIWMETDSIKIRDNILIRKPESNDLEFESYYSHYGSFIPHKFHNWPSAILEFEYREKFPRSVQNKIKSVIAALRLFKLGSIEQIRTRYNNKSIIRFSGGTVFHSNLLSAHYDYGLAAEDTENLTEFIARIEPLIYSEIIDKSADEADYISIAHDRFCDALLKPVVPENRLATAIMALEALYLKEKELSELTERLSQRVALALEPFGYKTLEVYNLVKKSYDIRSRFVHGSKIEQKEIGELPEKILDYCRVSIIMFLQLHNEMDKEKIINLLGKSLLDDTKKKEFHELINDKCPIKF